MLRASRFRRPAARAAALALACAAAALRPIPAEVHAELRAETGYRGGSFDWRIAGDLSGENPNVLSELSWDDLTLLHVALDGDVRFGRHAVLRGQARLGAILGGDNRDSDYLGDDRTLEYSRSENSGDGDELIDWAVAAGYRFELGRRAAWRLLPLAGFLWGSDNLRITHGRQTISDEDLAEQVDIPVQPLGPFEGLDSTYEARWRGPWAGIDLAKDVARQWELFGELRLERLDYEAEANWNLREDFAHPRSFAHQADGDGRMLAIGGRFRGLRFPLHARLEWRERTTDAGTDRLFFEDGEFVDTRLNGTNEKSVTLALGATFGPH